MKTSPRTVRHARQLGLLCIATLTLVAAACSSTSNTATANTSADGVLQCDNASHVAGLLQSGMPTYDYDPAPSLEALIQQSDIVITGTLASAVRVDGVDDGSGGESWTLIRTGEHQELYVGDPAVAGEFAADRSFIVSSKWAQRDVADPLAEPVNFEPAQTRFVAFLRRTQIAKAPWSVVIQGLHVGCGSGPVQSVMEPLPIDEPGSADDLTNAVLAIVDPQIQRDEANYESVPYRLLVEDIAIGDPYTVRRVTDFGYLPSQVGDFGVDLDSEVFFEFVLAESGSCDLGSIERLEFNKTSRILYPVLTQRRPESADCTADANPHLILVAIARSDLPTGAFSIAMSETGWPQEWTPKAFESGELTTPDPDDRELPILGDPSELIIGETGLLIGYTTHCSTDYLWWIVNGLTWVRSDEGSINVPGDWLAVEREQSVDLQITLVAADRIEAVARGAETRLKFAPADPQLMVGCD